jgi:4-amino-4-deoxy-L-arabinose transferase-like glycosyltransferase
MAAAKRSRRVPRERPPIEPRVQPVRIRVPLRRFRPELALFAVALALRLIYVAQSADSPSFLAPLVDAETYDRAAGSLASGEGFGEVFFYQPFFYPFYLGLVYAVSGSSILAAKLLQAVIGALTCVIVAGLGTRLLDRRSGLLAGAITAAYGPLIFLEAELVGEGWAALWSVALVWLFTAAPESPSWRRLGALGVVGGLAVITRPTFLPFVAAAALWLAIILWRQRRKDLLRGLAAAASGGLLVVLPVAWLCHRTTGEFHVLPSSGGLNLYIGNNPESCTTLTTRPGQEWQEMVTAPARAGAEGPWEFDRYFRAEVRRFATANRTAFTRGLAAKALQMVSSREIPRNLDIYLFRRWSSLLAATVWKAGPFGFPFGVLLPLALVGVVVVRRQLPAPLWLFLALYPAAVIVVFVSGRYRVPVIPVLAIPAAAGALALLDAAMQRRWRWLAVVVPVAAAAVALAVIPGPFCQEQDLEGEYWFLMSAAHLRHGDRDDAIDSLQRSIELEPSYFEARFQLGEMLLERGELESAIPHLERAVAERPDLGFAHRELGLALGRSGQLDRAAFHLRRALELEPEDPRALNFLGALLAQSGNLQGALGPLERAVALAPDYAAARDNLAWVRRQLASSGTP